MFMARAAIAGPAVALRRPIRLCAAEFRLPKRGISLKPVVYSARNYYPPFKSILFQSFGAFVVLVADGQARHMRERENGAAAAPENGVAAAGGDARRSLLVISNPIAGLLARVTAALAAAGIAVRTAATGARGDAARMARESCDGGTIAVAGGDGTINEAINGMAGGGARLALIPLGTANVLAAELGLPGEADALARIAAGDAVRAIHLGQAEIGGATRRFSMMAGVGFDAHVVANVPPGLKRAAGKLAYGWQMFVEWLRLAPRRYRVTADGTAYDCASVIVAKGRFYAGRYVAAPEASLDRASFELVLFERGGRLAVLRYALALGLGRLHAAKGVRILRAREVSIDGAAASAGGEPVHADGEMIGTLPARFTIAPDRLRVLVAAGPR
jgi:YegS/Rv2252/BmrU family lipid kinase